MILLPNVTLIALTNKDFPGHKLAIDKSCEDIAFGDVKIVWDEKIQSIDDWNYKIIYELPDYVRTSHALLVHADGYVQNPYTWKDEWLSYDYAGSPWPLPQDNFSYRDEEGNLVRVGNSVSLRSKKLMDLVRTRPWREYYGNTNEDGFISCHNRKWLEAKGCTFMPFKEAIYFGKEHELPENKNIKPFVFHSL